MFDQTPLVPRRVAPGSSHCCSSTTVVCLGLITDDALARFRLTKVPDGRSSTGRSPCFLLFVAVHVVGRRVRPVRVARRVLAAIVPLASVVRPIPVALGVISLYLLIAVIVTSLLRDRIGLRVWRTVHWAASRLAAGRGPQLYAGSDAFAPWMVAMSAGAVCVGAYFALAR